MSTHDLFEQVVAEMALTEKETEQFQTIVVNYLATIVGQQSAEDNAGEPSIQSIHLSWAKKAYEEYGRLVANASARVKDAIVKYIYLDIARMEANIAAMEGGDNG